MMTNLLSSDWKTLKLRLIEKSMFTLAMKQKLIRLVNWLENQFWDGLRLENSMRYLKQMKDLKPMGPDFYAWRKNTDIQWTKFEKTTNNTA